MKENFPTINDLLRDRPPFGEGHRIDPDNNFIKFSREETEQSIPHRIEKQVEKYPDLIAVRTKTHELTYEALNRTANRIARAILAGDQEGTGQVALLFEQGAPLIAASVGILKSGKTYVPLDPSYPFVRNTYMVDDAQVGLILTDDKNLSLAKELAQNKCQVINIEDLDAKVSDENIGLSISPDAIAYIIYTSGSTGQPKGVIQTHRNLLHFIRNYTNNLSISPNDRLSLFYSSSFSASLMDIFGALLNGAAVYPYDIRREGLANLSDWLVEEGVTIFHSVPTVFRHFVDGLKDKKKFPKLRLIDLGGEPVYKRDVELYRKHFSTDCVLVNHFAATELSVIAQYFIDSRTEITGSNVPAGYVAEGNEVILVDDTGQKVGFDQVGEIVIKSRYLSLGYWRKPDFTRAAFRPHPQGTSERSYHTGDLGRMRADGCLEHLGRKDLRVKVRGHSIEVAEIEMALFDLAAIKDAVVMAQEGHNGDKRLAAYVALEKGSKLNGGDLKNALRDSLPDFMIPTVLTILDELPRTPGGKVDRSQLKSLSPPRDQSDVISPRNSIEAHLVAVWERVLHVQPIGIREDFFNLGGDSLAAAELFAEIETIHGKYLPASTLLQASTVEQLARLIVAAESEYSSCVAIQTSGSNPPFFCVHGIGGDVISFRDLANYLGDDQPFYGLRAGSEDAYWLSVEAIAAHYVSEMQRLQPEGPYFLGGYSFGGTVAFEMARQLVAQSKEVGLLVLLDTYGPNYPKLLPLGKRLSIHCRTFLRAEPSEKWSYFRERILINAIRIKKTIRRFSYRYHMAAGGTPREGKTRNLEAVYQRAIWNYVAKPYNGKLDLFRAIKQKDIWHHDLLLGWDGLAGGGVQVHNIPGDHISLIAEPNVSILADRLRESLSKAREERENNNGDSAHV